MLYLLPTCVAGLGWNPNIYTAKSKATEVAPGNNEIQAYQHYSNHHFAELKN